MEVSRQWDKLRFPVLPLIGLQLKRGHNLKYNYQLPGIDVPFICVHLSHSHFLCLSAATAIPLPAFRNCRMARNGSVVLTKTRDKYRRMASETRPIVSSWPATTTRQSSSEGRTVAINSRKLKLNVDKIQMFSRFAIKSLLYVMQTIYKSRDKRRFAIEATKVPRKDV